LCLIPPWVSSCFADWGCECRATGRAVSPRPPFRVMFVFVFALTGIRRRVQNAKRRTRNGERGTGSTFGVGGWMFRVSIHAPVKGATACPPPRPSRSSCFNPRAREGRDWRMRMDEIEMEVSIHAPVKGATMLRPVTSRLACVSIHAPVKGATRASRGRRARSGFNPRAREGRDSTPTARSTATTGFNPRAREGRDVYLLSLGLIGEVSIHAPVKGATRATVRSCEAKRFQSTRP